MKNIVSLAVVAAMLASPVLASTHEGGGHRGGHHKRWEETLSKLPPEKAEMIRASMKQSREDSKAQWETGKKLHQELEALVRAEKFDKAAFLAKRQELSKLRSEMSAKRDAVMADNLSKLTPSERATLADGMQRKHHHAEKAPDAEKPAKE